MKRFDPKPLILLGVSTLLSLLVLELVWRLYMFGMDGLSYRAMNAMRPIGEAGVLQPSEFPDVIYELKPNLDTIVKKARVVTNAHGLADRPYPLAKPAGTFRVAVLGDSFTMPSGVPIEQAYHTVLEERLTRETGRPHEFINFAVGGYNLRIYLATLQRKALAYDPDLVLVGFYPGNDTEVLPEHRFTDRYKAKRPARAFLRMYAFERLQRLVTDAVTPKEQKAPDYDVPYLKDMFAGFVTATSGRIPIVVANLDHRPAKRPLVELLRQLCAEEGLYFVDISAFFRGADPKGLDIHPSDAHPNPRAHALYAELLGDYLKQQGLLARR